MSPKARPGGSTLKLTVTALFTAVIFLFTMFVKLPVGPGYVHFGDSLVYLFAALSGSPWALLAGGLGEALADIAGGFAAYAPATFLIKALMALPLVLVSRRSEKLLTAATGCLSVVSGLILVAGYFGADYILFRSAAVADIPGNAVQAAGSTVIFIVLAVVLDRVKMKPRYMRMAGSPGEKSDRTKNIPQEKLK